MAEHFRQIILESADGLPLRVDLVQDFGPQFGEHRVVGSLIVDSLENIAANKVVAILGRTEAKDFVDLFFLLQAGYDLDDLFAKAQQKDAGLQPFYFAGALLQVRQLGHLPEMVKPVSLDEVDRFLVELANRLMDRLRPERATGGDDARRRDPGR